MATCFENLVKHLEFVIRQLEQLDSQDRVEEENEDLAWELLANIEEPFINVFHD